MVQVDEQPQTTDPYSPERPTFHEDVLETASCKFIPPLGITVQRLVKRKGANIAELGMKGEAEGKPGF